jgi:hypothetical protein
VLDRAIVRFEAINNNASADHARGDRERQAAQFEQSRSRLHQRVPCPLTDDGQWPPNDRNGGAILPGGLTLRSPNPLVRAVRLMESHIGTSPRLGRFCGLDAWHTQPKA